MDVLFKLFEPECNASKDGQIDPARRANNEITIRVLRVYVCH